MIFGKARNQVCDRWRFGVERACFGTKFAVHSYGDMYPAGLAFADIGYGSLATSVHKVGFRFLTVDVFRQRIRLVREIMGPVKRLPGPCSVVPIPSVMSRVR